MLSPQTTRAEQNQSSPLLAYWHFEDNNYLDSQGNLTASCGAACPTTTTGGNGVVGEAQSFNGADTELLVAADPSLNWDTADTFAVAFWLKITPGACASSDEIVIGRGTPGSGHWALGCNQGEGTLFFAMSDSNNNSFSLSSSKVITTSNWHHVTAVYDGSQNSATLYVDYIDVQSDTPNLTGSLAGSNDDLHIGHLNSSQHLNGLLDEIALYTIPPSAHDIGSHYYLARRYTDMCNSPVTIMPLGDSITKGSASGVSAESEMISYRKTLWDMLATASYSVDFVGSLTNGQDYPGFDPQHEGHPSARKEHIRDAVIDRLNNNPAEVVLLHVGTNNVSTSIAEINQLLDNIDTFDENITVVLAQIINRIDNNATTTTYNNNLADLAADRIAEGDKIILVDMENGAGINYTAQPTGDMWDNLHPYYTGYDKMAAVWFNALQDVLPTCSESGPTIFSQPGTIAYTDLTYTYTVQANGSPAPTYSLDSFPAGMSIDPNSGLLEWIPTVAGSETITVTASNTAGSSTQSFTINVEESAEPVFTTTPALTATVGELYTYNAQADGNPPPTYTLTNSPVGMSIDPDSGVISWTPAQPGDNDVTVAATNDLNTATQSFAIIVSDSLSSSSSCQLSDAISYWKLDETSGTTFADSIGTNDGSCTAPNCPTPAAGQVNGAQAFDGTNRRVNVPASTDFDWAADDSFSIAVWVNIPDTATCSGNKVFIGLYGGGGSFGNRPAWWVGCDGGTNRATVFLGDNDNDSHQVTAGDTLLNDGNWHHVVVVREGDSVNQTRIYVDGSLKNSANLTFTGGFASLNGLNIGYYNVGSFFYLDGRLDEIAIYNRALTPTEIERHYQAGLVNLNYEYDNWTTDGGNWNDNASWYGDAPGSDDYVAILNNNTLTQPETAACVDVMTNATLDFGSHELTVNGAFSNRGTVKQTKPVNTLSELVEFLHVSGTAGSLYRGAEVTPTTTGLGNVEVTIRAADFDNDDYCTTTEGGSPDYAERCFTITPDTDGAASVRLYAHTDELAGLLVGDLRPYRFIDGTGWNALTTNLATGTEGDFAYAQADAPGFSSFLLGGPINPTAVSLANISTTTGVLPFAPITLLALIFLLLGSGMVYARRRILP